MKISIRKSKHQEQDLTPKQVNFAAECVSRYMKGLLTGELNNESYMVYEGQFYAEPMGCDVYQTKTTISAIVYFKD